MMDKVSGGRSEGEVSREAVLISEGRFHCIYIALHNNYYIHIIHSSSNSYICYDYCFAYDALWGRFYSLSNSMHVRSVLKILMFI